MIHTLVLKQFKHIFFLMFPLKLCFGKWFGLLQGIQEFSGQMTFLTTTTKYPIVNIISWLTTHGC